MADRDSEFHPIEDTQFPDASIHCEKMAKSWKRDSKFAGRLGESKLTFAGKTKRPGPAIESAS